MSVLVFGPEVVEVKERIVYSDVFGLKASTHKSLHTFVTTYIHTYIHTYTHTHIHTSAWPPRSSRQSPRASQLQIYDQASNLKGGDRQVQGHTQP